MKKASQVEVAFVSNEFNWYIDQTGAFIFILKTWFLALKTNKPIKRVRIALPLFLYLLAIYYL